MTALLKQQQIEAKIQQFGILEQKVQHMEQVHANAVTAEDLINQMINDGTMHQADDGSFVVLGTDG